MTSEDCAEYAKQVLDIIESFIPQWEAEGTLGRLPNEQWEILRKIILKRDKYTCQNCYAANLQLDVHHIVPVGNHGTNHLSNLVTLCNPCHILVHPHMEAKYERTTSSTIGATVGVS